MKPQNLKREIGAALQSAATVLLESSDWKDAGPIMRAQMTHDMMDACAANLAQGLATRTISEETAIRAMAPFADGDVTTNAIAGLSLLTDLLQDLLGDDE
jgi:hypothetical protein